MTDFVGGNAGTKLKATSGWSNNGNGIDDFGFSALPGGNFYGVGTNGYWWSATESSAPYALYRNMNSNFSDVSRSGIGKGSLHSVRCLKD